MDLRATATRRRTHADVAFQAYFEGPEAIVRPLEELVEVWYLLEAAALDAVNVALRKAPGKRRLSVTVREKDTAPEVVASVLEMVRSAQPTSRTPAERAARKVEIRATIIKERRRLGLEVLGGK